MSVAVARPGPSARPGWRSGSVPAGTCRASSWSPGHPDARRAAGLSVVYNLWLGFHQKHAIQPVGTWVGLANYTYFLFGDRQFWDSFWLGLVYAIVTVVAQLVLGVAAALLLNEDFRGG